LLCSTVLKAFGNEPETNAESSVFAGVGVPREAVWSVQPKDGQSLQITVDFGGFSAVKEQNGYSLRIPGQAESAKPGTPDIPHIAKLFNVSSDGHPVLTIRGMFPTNVQNVSVVPAKGVALEQSEDETRRLRTFRRPQAEVYAADQLYPESLSKIDEARIGTQRVLRIEICPVQYNPIKREIRFYQRLEGVLEFTRKRPDNSEN
jgi:hypothetical protein